MASILLSTVGSAVGSATGIPGGGILGSRIGRLLGGAADSRIFSSSIRLRDREGPRLADLAVQTSTYGRMIPILYGTVRIAGNIIWSQPIREVATTSTSSSGGGGGKGGGGRVTQSSTTYSYFVSLAIAICEGPVDEVLRIWADAKQLDLSRYTLRTYTGDSAQLPDGFIQGVEGADNTPAYRGLAYVVIENFPLADFGNRIPNFTFEVRKKAQASDYNGETLENMIHSVTLIPGAGEFVYDTQVEYKVPGSQVGVDWVQQGEQLVLNMHNASGRANMLLALDQLKATCPNVEWVSVVVSWFGDSVDANACVIKPGVEYQNGATTSPDTWSVAGFTRATARQITLEGGSPRFGGTPDDGSILRLLDELIARGYKVMLYPMLFLDVAGKPWRGTLATTAANIPNFFTKTDGYNAFITHYANLVASRVDGFIIGSELKALTEVTDTPGGYPAVSQLLSLAATVKAIVGSSVKVTYAADWSEYHHTVGGYYHMDPLWASPNIDMIGIDAYFPLTDEPQNGYSVQKCIDGWTSGEGYDWYYSDPARTTQTSLSAAYAWKNLSWFWNNTHTNPGGVTTAWVPNSKKIWFTEYGFPSVDGATNQPNVFYDPATSGSAFPYFSRGRVDFRAQRAGLMATEAKWKASSMVERMFAWTWDARPYPYWPDLTNVWNDGAAWKTGHWLQGKLGISSLSAIVKDLSLRSGLSASDIDVSNISDQVEGFVVSGQQSIRSVIEQLAKGYFFDAVESDGVISFIPRRGTSVITISDGDVVPQKSGELISATRAQEVELPKRISVVYLNRLSGYQADTQYAQREATESKQAITVDLPLVLSDQSAKIVADISLYSAWISRVKYHFYLPIKFAALEPADIIDVSANGVIAQMRITATQLTAPGMLRVDAVAEDQSAYDFYTAPRDASTNSLQTQPASTTITQFLDIPALPGDAIDSGMLRIAASGASTPWNGSVIYRSDDGGVSFERLADVPVAAVSGTAITALSSGPTAVFDETSTVNISLLGSAELASITEIAVLNGANAALIGNEIIQFKNATLLEPGKYSLGGMLRGRLGTEWARGSHMAGERFVLLTSAVGRISMPQQLLGLSRPYKAVSVGGSESTTSAQNFAYSGIALKPYAPVQVAGTRDSFGNLTITWIRRTRVSGEWVDNVDVPLNESWERYEVDILQGGITIRTLSGLVTPTAIYTSAQQIADFGSNQTSVNVRVYQLSALVGRGYKAEMSV